MIYPINFENKIEFNSIRNYLKSYCISNVAKEYVDNILYLEDLDKILPLLNQTNEFVSILNCEIFPDIYIYDLRNELNRIKIKDTYLSNLELWELSKTFKSLISIYNFLQRKNDNNEYVYPFLNDTTKKITINEKIIYIINSIIDENGLIKDNASNELRKIRIEKSNANKKITKLLTSILKNAQKEGYINNNVYPTHRDGRLVIPISPVYKKKISGIIHDESDSGKTVFIEPSQVVEANNEITELDNKERKEIIRILKKTSEYIRPLIDDYIYYYEYLGKIDFIRAKAKFAILTKCILPDISPFPLIEWESAIHPILKLHIEKKNLVGFDIVPLDIKLSSPRQRILIISGPNAGGKSVCLKTVGLLQYMLQCGLLIPLSENSKCGIFKSIFINIGDEQSIEDELSTFSSYLINMKNMMKYSDENSLCLIDEFGSGTEPMIGGSMAQAMLKKLNRNKIFGVITTHFQNLKQFAQETDGILNGSMLYDKNQMKPLFQLKIGNPGSSFAIEIARKIGIPEDVVQETVRIVGKDYISSEKYLQDILRDKKYWENKRLEIHQKEKRIDDIINKYNDIINQLNEERTTIIRQAQHKANLIIERSNSIIEKTIKEIKEAEAEKNKTKELRAQINQFKEEINNFEFKEFENKIKRQYDKNKQRREGNKNSKHTDPSPIQDKKINKVQKIDALIKNGDFVKLKDQQTIGKVLKINNNEALIAFGSIKMNIPLNKLEKSNPPKIKKRAYTFVSKETQDKIRETTLNFNSEIDVRGMRGDEALQAIQYFIDDALVASVHRLRILHGTGSGILKTLIRQHLSKIKNVVSYKDEHPQFGGAGITIVELE